MNLGLEGRTALVLGASSGLGLASAQALREEGANVVMFARRESLLRSEADRIAGKPVVGDIRSPEDLQAAVGASVAAHGGLDIVVLNGGGPPLAAAGDLTDESIVDAFDLLMRPIVRLIGPPSRICARAGRVGSSRSRLCPCASRSRASPCRTQSDRGCGGI